MAPGRIVATRSCRVELQTLVSRGFLGVYSAVYDYQPQGEGELQFQEGDLLYILDKNSDDGWWKAKKKAEQEDEDEPEGLVPNNYVEEVSTRQSQVTANLFVECG